jgi:hypothetical protein
VSKIHAINLTDAWEHGTTDDRGPTDARGCGLSEACPGTRAGRLTRRFGCPTGLTPADRVWLVCESPDTRPGDEALSHDIRLNGASLPALVGGGRRRAEVTLLLESRNELVVVGSGVGPWDGRRRLPDQMGRVWLEIEAAS